MLRGWVLWLFLLFGSTAAQAVSNPVDFIREVSATLAGQAGRVSLPQGKFITKVARYYDFSALFDRASKDFRTSLTVEQSERLKALFTDLLTKRMIQKAHRLIGKDLKNPQYSLKGQQGGEATVLVRGTLGQRAVKLEFTVVSKRDVYKIVDLAVSGALLSRNYQGQFNRIFRVEGAEGLEKRMRQQ